MLAFVVHGIAALVIILVILGIFVAGLVSVFRITGRGIHRVKGDD